MKNISLYLYFALVAGVCGAFAASASSEVRGKVSRDVDGDTLWIETEDGEEVKVRLHGIDAPETRLPSPQGVVGQGKWGKRASAFLKELAGVGTRVSLKEDGVDKYDRTLGHVFVGGNDVNLALLEKGWAVPYIFCQGASCDEDYFALESAAEYLAACMRAKKAGLGIFDPADPLKEMPFEFRLRMQERDPDKYVGDFESGRYFEPEDYSRVDICKQILFSNERDARRAGFLPVDELASSHLSGILSFFGLKEIL